MKERPRTAGERTVGGIEGRGTSTECDRCEYGVERSEGIVTLEETQILAEIDLANHEERAGQVGVASGERQPLERLLPLGNPVLIG